MKTDFITRLLDLIYPPRCPVCNDIIPAKKRYICDRCNQMLQYVDEPYCLKCGKPVDLYETEYCSDCLSKNHYYDEGRAALVYDEYMSRSIYRFKYNGIKEYAGFYGKVMYDRLKGKISSWNAQALIPVPIHKSRMKVRGYNQAALIARALSKHCGIPVDEDLVIRKNQTRVQKSLSGKDRENNLKKAFHVTSNSVKYTSVIIVDDIYTTGSTIDSLAKCLKDAGILNVYFLALSIGRGQ